jgi:hypothetical protein
MYCHCFLAVSSTPKYWDLENEDQATRQILHWLPRLGEELWAKQHK